MSEFGITIREGRLRLNLSLRALAKKVDVTASYLSRIENGICPPPSPEVVQSLSDALDEDYDRLLLMARKIDPEVQKKVSRMLPEYDAIMKLLDVFSSGNPDDEDDPLGGAQGTMELIMANTVIAEIEGKKPQQSFKYMYSLLKQLSKYEGEGLPENIKIRREIGNVMLDFFPTLAVSGTENVDDIRSEIKDLIIRLFQIEGKTLPEDFDED